MSKDLFNLKKSEQLRTKVTLQQQKEIRQMYMSLHSDIDKRIKQLDKNNLKKQNLIVLKKQIEDRLKNINNDNIII